MASEIIVNTIKAPTTGANANKVIIPSGVTLDANAGEFKPPAGAVIQYVRKVVDQNNHAYTSSSSYVDVASSAVSITPKYANSLIKFSAKIFLHAQTGNNHNMYTVFRDSTDLSTLYNATRCGEYGSGADGAHNTYDSFVYFIHDTPNTTNSVTYSIKFKRSGGANNLYAHAQALNEFTLEEIAQ